MHINRFFLLAGFLAFLFSACGEENPSDILFTISSSSSLTEENSSSSVIEEYSSSLDSFSSSIETSSSSWEPFSYGELIDERDGQTYKTIKIGEQTWMAENLNYAYLQPTSTRDSASECYNNDPGNCTKYGRLYTWHAAIDSITLFSENGNVCDSKDRIYYYPCKSKPYIGVEGVCPDSWHVPTRNEAMNLVKYANTSSENFEWIKHYWLLGENEENNFLSEANVGYVYFWISEESERNGSKIYIGPNETEAFYFTGNKADLKNISKSLKVFVRCVKDNEPPLVEHGEMTDERDGQVYKTVKIGTQTWMAENLNYTYPKQDSSSDSVSWCYNNEPDSCAKYGRLYTWDAAMNSCPQNWHLPSYGEWVVLTALANYEPNYFKSTSGWSEDGNGSDIFGFGVLPGGIYKGEKGMDGGNKEWIRNADYVMELDCGSGDMTSFWTTDQFTYVLDVYTYDHAISICFSSQIEAYPDSPIHKSWGLSVRCVKDAEASE